MIWDYQSVFEFFQKTHPKKIFSGTQAQFNESYGARVTDQIQDHAFKNKKVGAFLFLNGLFYRTYLFSSYDSSAMLETIEQDFLTVRLMRLK